MAAKTRLSKDELKNVSGGRMPIKISVQKTAKKTGLTPKQRVGTRRRPRN